MLQKEFEERIGRKAEAGEFETANAIYMYGGIDKDEFCRLYTTMEGKQSLLEEMLRQLQTEEAAHNECTKAKNKRIEAMENDQSDAADILIGKACAYDDTDLYNMAVRMIGEKNVVLRKISMGLPLWDEDKELIRTAFKMCDDQI